MASVEVYGLNQLMARLAKMKEELESATADALREVAAQMRDDAKAFCPVDTGSLRASIRVQAYVKPKAHFYNVGVSAGGYVTNPKSGMKVNYASHVEFGTSRQRAQPFMRPAYEGNKHNILRIMKEGLKK